MDTELYVLIVDGFWHWTRDLVLLKTLHGNKVSHMTFDLDLVNMELNVCVL